MQDGTYLIRLYNTSHFLRLFYASYVIEEKVYRIQNVLSKCRWGQRFLFAQVFAKGLLNFPVAGFFNQYLSYRFSPDAQVKRMIMKSKSAFVGQLLQYPAGFPG